MLTRSQTRMNSNNVEVQIKSKTVAKPQRMTTHKPVVAQQRMTTRSQARQTDFDEDETEVITLHVNPSKNRRIVPDDDNVLPRRSSRINFDEASVAWRSNKRSIGNGQFEYI